MSNEEFLAGLRRNAERYEEIKHLADRVQYLRSAYARNEYRVVLDDETRALSDQDLLILCDGGNACFGGKVGSRVGSSVPVSIYTD